MRTINTSSGLQRCSVSLDGYNSSSQSLQLKLSGLEPTSVGASCYNTNDVPLNLLRGGNNSRGGVNTSATAAGKGGLGDLHLLRDGPTDGNGKGEADDDEYINTLRLLRGGDGDGDESDDGDDERDLLRDGLDGGDDGPHDDPDDDNDDGDPDDDGSGAAIH
nr:hypothetical protein [Tanacetum cinerariifolium]